jgi:hypothetical protein
MFGFGLLLTRDVLITVGLLCPIAFFWIMPSVFSSMGLVDPASIRTSRDYDDYLPWYGSRAAQGPWFRMWHHAVFGMTVVIAYWFVLRYRNEIIETIRAAMSGEEEGRTYRMLWIGWLVSGAAAFVALMLIGQAAWLALFSLVLFATQWLFFSRANAETGMWFGGWMFHEMGYYFDWAVPGYLNYNFNWSSASPLPMDRSIAYPYYAVDMMHQGAGWQGGLPNVAGWQMDSFKLANITKTKWTDMIPASLLACIIGFGVAVPLNLMLFYQFGEEGRLMQNHWNGGIEGIVTTGMQSTFVPMGPGIEKLIAILVGCVIAIIALGLRSLIGGAFSYFNIIAMILFWEIGPFAWLPYLVAFIVQRVVTRIGGVALYRRKVQPLAIGLVLGLALLWLITAIQWPLRGIAAYG